MSISNNNSGGMSSRVSIPRYLRKTIEDIKEISGNHIDEDVYAMLQECSMDPNETVQRLLFLDTFHEVKRKRDKRKDNGDGRLFESSRRNPGNQGRWARGGRVRFSSRYTSHDAGGERIAAVMKENGLEDKREPSLMAPPLPDLKGVETKLYPSISKTSSVPVNGPACLPSDGLSNGHVVQYSEIVNTVLPNHVKDVGLIKLETTLSRTKVNAKHAPSADANLVPMQSCDSQIPIALSAGKSHDVAASLKDLVINSNEFADETQTNKHPSSKADTSGLCISTSENSKCRCPSQSKMNGESLGGEKLSFSPASDTVQFSLQNAAVPTNAIEEVTTKLNKLKGDGVQHVILPNHIQVPDAVKNILSFGSLHSRFGVDVNDIKSSVSNKNSSQASEFLEDESAEDSESCAEGTPTAQEENYPDPPQAPQNIPETILPTENSFPPPKDDQVKQETFPAVGPPYPALQPAPAYGFGFMPPMLGSPLVHFEGLDHQARLLNSVIGSSLSMSTSAPTPPVQSPEAVQGAVAMPAPSLPLMRQQYPPNYIPYAHYFPPFFMPPALQFLGHGGFPPQFPTGNIYLPAAAATADMKASATYKPGSNVMSQAPVGMQSGAFGVYGSPQAGYNPSAAVTSGSSNVNEDHVPAVLKENNVYLGQQSEGTTVWLPAPGRDSTTFPINPFFSLPPHITISPQSGPGAFATMFHPLLNVAPQAAAQPLVQQTESIPGQPEAVGLLPPPNSFHQPPQHQQMNWTGGF